MTMNAVTGIAGGVLRCRSRKMTGPATNELPVCLAKRGREWNDED
jgi:hypothetical protein